RPSFVPEPGSPLGAHPGVQAERKVRHGGADCPGNKVVAAVNSWCLCVLLPSADYRIHHQVSIILRLSTADENAEADSLLWPGSQKAPQRMKMWQWRAAGLWK